MKLKKDYQQDVITNMEIVTGIHTSKKINT